MGKVIVSGSMSLDGFGCGPDVGVENPMGVGGERLHTWLFAEDAHPADVEAGNRMRAAAGAVVLGWRTFSIGLDIWGDVPFPAPCFVVTRTPAPDLAQPSGTFSFVSTVEEAVAGAQAVSPGDVLVMGGGSTVGAVLRASLADEVWVELISITLGAGTPMFPSVGELDLDPIAAETSPYATHLRYRVRRQS